jgi:hypothetical protein
MHVHAIYLRGKPVDDGRFQDPVLELNRRLGGDIDDIISLAGEITNADAEIALSVLDEVEAEERAAGILAAWRRQGYTL